MTSNEPVPTITVGKKLEIYKNNKKEKEKIRQEMFAFARQQCEEQLKEMMECFKKHKFLTSIACRKESRERDDCLFK